MTRKDFIAKSAALGAGLPFLSWLLTSCDGEELLYPNFEVNFDGKVLIIGAGAAGLTAAYVLSKYNIDFDIIEASAVWGGRLKRADDFADFPIDLGAEWIHTDPSILAKLISDATVQAEIDIIPYSPETIQTYKKESRRRHNWASNFYSEYKFKSTTWYGFLEQYMLPAIGDRLIYNSPVNRIDYTADNVLVQNLDGDTYQAEKVLVTVPLTILQNNSISFEPTLPDEKVDAINSITMPEGIKVFMEFSERFYPDILFVGGLIESLIGENRIYYDAAFRKDSERHILGLFNVDATAASLTQLETDAEIIAAVLSELDEMFDGKASETYIKHIVQNWSKEPYIQGSYGIHYEESQLDTAEKIAAPVEGKVYFAGEAMGGYNAATVHGAAESAYAAVENILKG